MVMVMVIEMVVMGWRYRMRHPPGGHSKAVVSKKLYNQKW